MVPDSVPVSSQYLRDPELQRRLQNRQQQHHWRTSGHSSLWKPPAPPTLLLLPLHPQPQRHTRNSSQELHRVRVFIFSASSGFPGIFMSPSALLFSGGRLITIHGQNLDVVQEPHMVVTYSQKSISQRKKRGSRRRARRLASSSPDPACQGDPLCPDKQVSSGCCGTYDDDETFNFSSSPVHRALQGELLIAHVLLLPRRGRVHTGFKV